MSRKLMMSPCLNCKGWLASHDRGRITRNGCCCEKCPEGPGKKEDRGRKRLPGYIPYNGPTYESPDHRAYLKRITGRSRN